MSIARHKCHRCFQFLYEALIKPSDRTHFSIRIASEIESNSDQIVLQAQVESALPVPRPKSETWRTIVQN